MKPAQSPQHNSRLPAEAPATACDINDLSRGAPWERLVIVGVGLLGGSIALAARARNAACRIVGVGRQLDRLRAAQQHCQLDDISTDLAAAVERADFVVICTPVDRIAADILTVLAAGRHPKLVVTDVGSTKVNIETSLQAAIPTGTHPAALMAGPITSRYVGSHPMAGSEQAGFQAATAELFSGRRCLVMPDAWPELAATTAGSDDVSDALCRDRAKSAVVRFWQWLGMTVQEMTAAEHDAAMAAVSHLPHVVAAALVQTLPAGWQHLPAGGFRDTTRIASGDPALWAAILQANRENLVGELDRLTAEFSRLRVLLQRNDAAELQNWLQTAKTQRDQVFPKSGVTRELSSD